MYTIVHEHFEEIFHQKAPKYGRSLIVLNSYEYSLEHGIRSGDAIVAATAVEHHETLMTSNKKHFRCLKDLDCEFFVP